MSKALDSPSRPRSRSRSRSRSYSRSRSRSQSRSRSRKRHYSSRSRSRSHSPAYRNYPSRDYQGNNRGFRGYNRGYRRPYHYRGRNRGYYPRGNYQNRGRGGGGYGYKSNWQGGGGGGGGGGGWHDRQEHHSPRRAYSRSRTPKKRSASRSRSRVSERSSSGRSRRSRHSSYSSRSRSSSRRRDSKGRTRSKDAKERQPESRAEKAAPSATDGGTIAKASGGKWVDYEGSPKRRSPDSKKDDAPSPEGEEPSGGGPLWKTVGSLSPPAKSPSKSGQTGSFSSFGFFSKEDAPAGDSAMISAAFKKFLSDKQHKKLAAEKESSREKERGSAEREPQKSSKSSDLFGGGASYAEPKDDKTLPFFDPVEEEFLESQGLKERINEDTDAKPAPSVRDVFGKWGDDPTYPKSYQSSKEKGRREEEEEEAADDAEEELYRSRKHSKKEEKSKKKEKKEKSKRSLTPPAPSKEKERPLFPGAFPDLEASPPCRLAASRDEFELKMSSLEELPSSSVSKDRLAAPRSSKKDSEFRSIFQHVQPAPLRRSPTELFAQHIVSIVHYIKAQHFPSSDVTLSERFAMYQRKAAEAEMMKPRKSPEIHRRIDVSPSAFKRHPHLFEDVDETSYKDAYFYIKRAQMCLISAEKAPPLKPMRYDN